MPIDGSLLTFAVAALIVLVIPGPSVLYIIARSVSQGRQAGLVSAVGLSAGALFHVVAATAGLSALLLTSATAFAVVKGLGAGYLIYLGVRALLDRSPPATTAAPAERTLRRIFLDGVLVNVLNPKAAVFFMAFLPQFADPSRGAVPTQILLLGLVYCGMALITDAGYALLASQLRRWFGHRFGGSRLPRYASGTCYIGLGVGTALAERS